MAKITWSDRAKTEQLQDAFPSFNSSFIPDHNRFQQGVTNALRNGLTLFDNMQAAKVTINNYVHNTTRVDIPNPLYPAIPLFFAPYLSMLTNGQAGLPLAGGFVPVKPVQNGKFLSLSMAYQLPVGERLDLALTASTSLTTGTDTTVSWSGVLTPSSNAGTAMSWNGTTKIQMLESGVYHLRCFAAFAQSAAGGRAADLFLNGTRIDAIELPAAPAATFTQIELTRDLICSAGDFVEMHVTQSSGGALNLVGNGSLTSLTNASGRAMFGATRIKNNTAYTANVTGVLFGG